ncbi:MAG: hypothetical protein ACLSB9_37370 [Hydrogeniiclostridium mannosilyticum]
MRKDKPAFCSASAVNRRRCLMELVVCRHNFCFDFNAKPDDLELFFDERRHSACGQSRLETVPFTESQKMIVFSTPQLYMGGSLSFGDRVVLAVKGRFSLKVVVEYPGTLQVSRV